MVIHARSRCGRNSSTNAPAASVVTVATAATFTTITSLATLATLAIGSAVAAYTVIQIADALVAVLTQNVLHRVLMAAVAGVAAVIIVDVASDALRVVVFVQHK